MLVYDLTSKASLEKLQSWKKEFINQGGIDNAENFPFIIVGNKSDRPDRAVDAEDVQGFSEANGGMKWFDTSAKEGTGIYEAMEEAVKLAAAQKKLEEDEIFIPGELDIKPREKLPQSGGNCGC